MNELKEDEKYCIFNETMPVCISKSLFSLLIEISNLKNEYPSNKYHIMRMS